MLNFSSNLKIVQEPSISKFVTHKLEHDVTIISSQAENSSEMKSKTTISSLLALITIQ